MPEPQPHRPETVKERRLEKHQAKSRDMTVEEWRERKAANQAKFRQEQIDKLEDTPLKLSFKDDLAVQGTVELAAWEGTYSSVLSFLKAAYERSGETDPMEVNRKARAVQRFIVGMVGDDYLAMTSAAVLRFQGNTLTIAGIHSNKYGKRVEEIIHDRMLEARMEEAQRSRPAVPTQPSKGSEPGYFVGNADGIRKGSGTLPEYNPADDGLTQRADGTWVSNGTKPEKSGPSTVKRLTEL